MQQRHRCVEAGWGVDPAGSPDPVRVEAWCAGTEEGVFLVGECPDGAVGVFTYPDDMGIFQRVYAYPLLGVDYTSPMVRDVLIDACTFRDGTFVFL